MLKLIMIRHAEPDYSFCDERNFIGHGMDLAPLSQKGIEQAEVTAKDKRLIDVELIISSPYTRALQTAAIISRTTGIKLVVEVDIREWQPDLTFQYKNLDECLELCSDYEKSNGRYPDGKICRWEQTEDLKRRINGIIERYKRYNKIIMVSHSMAMRTVCGIDDIHHAGIVECEI